MDLLKHKEFYQFKIDPERNYRDPPGGHDELVGSYLKQHSHQLFIRNFVSPNTDNKRMILMHGTGCHAKGSLIRMHGGSIMPIEDILAGDTLMGDDGRPRLVVKLVRGVDVMYRIELVNPPHGDRLSFIVNRGHIMPLSFRGGAVYDIALRDIVDSDRIGETFTPRDYELLLTRDGATAHYKFTITVMTNAPYYGFAITGNKRYLDAAGVHHHNTGKCHAAGTKLLLHGGGIVNVEDVIPGTQLIGDDGEPRRVLSICSGRDRMFCVEPDVGLAFRVNSAHIMTVRVRAAAIDTRANKDEWRTIDIPIKCLMKLRSSDWRLIRHQVDYPSQPIVVGPYLAGQMIGYIVDNEPAIISTYLYNTRYVRREFLRSVCESGYKLTSPHLAMRLVYAGMSIGEIYIIKADNTLAHHCEYTTLVCAKISEEERKDDYYGFTVDGNHRYLMGCCTVTHNSLGAVSIAQEFCKVYKTIYTAMYNKMSGRRNYAELDVSTPSVFVLGFAGTRGAFTRELMKYPEFGFISMEERDELLRRQKYAESEIAEDVKNFTEMYNHIRRRITNKSTGGFYKFFGYQEFVNRLFISDKVKLVDLEHEANTSGGDITLEDLVHAAIERGDIGVNRDMVESLKGSLIIADEIHETYNTRMKNNYGVAIQFALDSDPNIVFVGMSATLINNSPTEVVEVINYVCPKAEKVKKRDLFADQHNLKGDAAIAKIGDLVRGRISFLQDTNLKYYPRREYKGEMIKIPHQVHGMSAGSEIPYLPFIRATMPPLLQRTLNELVSENNHEGRDPYHGIPTDAYTLFDMVFPVGAPPADPSEREEVVYRSQELRTRIGATNDKHIYMVRQGNTIYPSGEFLMRENIGRYNSKCVELLRILDGIFERAAGDPDKGEKVMIFHDRVRMSGVLLIQELLKMNGYVDETTVATDNTRCSVCGKTLKAHEGRDKRAGHDYTPARFVIAHSDIDKNVMSASLAKFNMPDNMHGHRFKILIGSKIIKQSYDFKDIQNMIIMSIPTNVPTLIQVFGRGDRKNSHINLPPSQRRMAIHMLCSSVNREVEHMDEVSPEEYRYIDKMLDYKTIQIIESVFQSVAIDADIHRDIIMPPELYKIYFPPTSGAAKPGAAKPGVAKPIERLGNLYFEPEETLPQLELKDLKLSTYHARGYDHEEIGLITSIIKRLFMREPVWVYDELWDVVRAPPFGIEYNPRLFAEGNFIIALEGLVGGNTAKLINNSELVHSMANIFDPANHYIYPAGGRRHKVSQVGKYYILFPDTTDDAETYLRTFDKRGDIEVDVGAYVHNEYMTRGFKIRRAKFIDTIEDYVDMLVDYDEDFQRAMIEEAIVAGLTTRGALPRHQAETLKLYNRFGIIVYNAEVKVYKDIVKIYKAGAPPKTTSAIGYVSKGSVRLYDPDSRKWHDIAKAAINRHNVFRENDMLIGYFETMGDRSNFKIRNPSAAFKVKHDTTLRADDSRLKEKGMVCGTQGKDKLIEMAAKLGIRTKGRLKEVCAAIMRRMLDNEARERGKESRVKWVYGWWDQN